MKWRILTAILVALLNTPAWAVAQEQKPEEQTVPAQQESPPPAPPLMEEPVEKEQQPGTKKVYHLTSYSYNIPEETSSFEIREVKDVDNQATVVATHTFELNLKRKTIMADGIERPFDTFASVLMLTQMQANTEFLKHAVLWWLAQPPIISNMAEKH